MFGAAAIATTTTISWWLPAIRPAEVHKCAGAPWTASLTNGARGACALPHVALGIGRGHGPSQPRRQMEEHRARPLQCHRPAMGPAVCAISVHTMPHAPEGCAVVLAPSPLSYNIPCGAVDSARPHMRGHSVGHPLWRGPCKRGVLTVNAPPPPRGRGCGRLQPP